MSQYRRQRNYKPGTQDSAQTPPHAVEPLAPYIERGTLVWECAADEGFLTWGIRNYLHCEVLMTDIKYDDRLDFFKYKPTVPVDYLITNPPFSLKYVWLERCYELKIPFALLLPVYTIGSAKAQKLFKKHGVEVMYLDRRINFKMPYKGWGSSAHFSCAWFCWHFLPKERIFGCVKQELEMDWKSKINAERFPADAYLSRITIEGA